MAAAGVATNRRRRRRRREYNQRRRSYTHRRRVRHHVAGRSIVHVGRCDVDGVTLRRRHQRRWRMRRLLDGAIGHRGTTARARARRRVRYVLWRLDVLTQLQKTATTTEHFRYRTLPLQKTFATEHFRYRNDAHLGGSGPQTTHNWVAKGRTRHAPGWRRAADDTTAVATHVSGAERVIVLLTAFV